MPGTQVRARPEEVCRPVGPEKPAGGVSCQPSILGTRSGQLAVGLEKPRPSGAEDPTAQVESYEWSKFSVQCGESFLIESRSDFADIAQSVLVVSSQKKGAKILA